jgi:hypothetical protein
MRVSRRTLFRERRTFGDGWSTALLPHPIVEERKLSTTREEQLALTPPLEVSPVHALISVRLP